MSVARTARRRRRMAVLDHRYKVRSKEHDAKRNALVMERMKDRLMRGKKK
jgi:hypothetical protein